jgi:hypothetical protein
VVYWVYHGPAEMEDRVTHQRSARGGSRMRELDTIGQRERERERESNGIVLTSGEGRQRGKELSR